MRVVMKKNHLKSLAFLTAVLFTAGCASAPPETAETTASPKEETAAQTTAPETTSVTETAESTESEPKISKWLADYLEIRSLTFTDDDKALVEMIYKNSEINFREENKPSDPKSPTLAKEIYQLLYDYADLNDYLYSYLPMFTFGEPIIADRIRLSHSYNFEDSGFVQWESEEFFPVKYGTVKTIGDYYRRICRLATWEYIERDDPWLNGILRSSQGDLYAADFRFGASRANSDSVLNKIVKTDDDTLRLEFTAFYFQTAENRETEAADYTVILSKGKGYLSYECEPDGKWRIDRCDWNAMCDLCSEIINGGEEGLSPKTDLPEQIERCLKESGLM